MSQPASLDSHWNLAAYRQRFVHLPSAADVVYHSLREAILDGEIEYNTWLREEELAREFGVSRTPVRQALLQLNADGLVDVVHRQGAVVSQLSTDDIAAIYLVREVLEGLSARLAARRATQAQRAELSSIVEAMEAAARDGDVSGIAEANLRFHRTVRAAANNRHLDRFLSQIEQSVRRFGKSTLAHPGRARSAVDEHRKIAEAIASGNTELAEALATQHLRQARMIRLQMLLEDE